MNIKIHVRNKLESALVQTKAFMDGIIWLGGQTTPWGLECEYLYMLGETISCSSCSHYSDKAQLTTVSEYTGVAQEVLDCEFDWGGNEPFEDREAMEMILHNLQQKKKANFGSHFVKTNEREYLYHYKPKKPDGKVYKYESNPQYPNYFKERYMENPYLTNECKKKLAAQVDEKQRRMFLDEGFYKLIEDVKSQIHLSENGDIRLVDGTPGGGYTPYDKLQFETLQDKERNRAVALQVLGYEEPVVQQYRCRKCLFTGTQQEVIEHHKTEHGEALPTIKSPYWNGLRVV